jgi:hypothetical protein
MTRKAGMSCRAHGLDMNEGFATVHEATELLAASRVYRTWLRLKA